MLQRLLWQRAEYTHQLADQLTVAIIAIGGCIEIYHMDVVNALFRPAYGTPDGYRYRVNVFRQRGTVAMANKGFPDSGNSQFFIVHDDEIGRQIKNHLITRAKAGVRVRKRWTTARPSDVVTGSSILRV